MGATNGGYIRRISSINKQQGKLTFTTSQGTMEDVFQKAQFDFSIGTDGLIPQGRGTTEHAFDISGINLYQNGPVSIKLDKGLINVGGDWDFDFDFEDSKLHNFTLACKNASFNGQFDFKVTADQAFNLADTTVKLKRVVSFQFRL